MYFEEGVDAVTSASVNIEGDDISGNAQLLAKMAQEVTGGCGSMAQRPENFRIAERP